MGFGLKCFIDVDHLSEISKEELRDSVANSCAMLVVLDDETVTSTWCNFEWELAKELGIPTKCVVDVEHYLKGEIIEQVTNTNSYLLKYQWSNWTDRTRHQVCEEI